MSYPANSIKIYVKVLLVLALALVVGCAAKKEDSSSQGFGDTTTTQEDQKGNVQLSYKVSSAQTLVATDQTVESNNSGQTARLRKDGKKLFTYKIVNQGLSGLSAKESALVTQRQALAVASDPTADLGVIGANLLAVDDQGVTYPAIETNYPIKVMYSVVDPAGTYVYLAFDTGWEKPDGNDYAAFIAQENCAFYRVAVADNSYTCVHPGVFVQKMDDRYMQSISGNQKPIQFDDDSNVYFTATKFKRHEDTATECCDAAGNQYLMTYHWIDQTDWNPRVYKMDAASGVVSGVTQDNESVGFFLTLPSGEVAYQAYDLTNWTPGDLFILQPYFDATGAEKTRKINLTNDSAWEVSFFTRDHANSVIWGTWDIASPGVEFARPLSSGNATHRVTLNTSLFGGNAWGNPMPRRLIIADDGGMYGVFESCWDQTNNGAGGAGGAGGTGTPPPPCENLVLSVYQMLPYNGTPRLELKLKSTNVNRADVGWWDWMGLTPFQVANGYLFYKETQEVIMNGAFYGIRDVIRMVRVSDRVKVSALHTMDPATPETLDQYTLYSWSLRNGILYFSGLNNATNTVVTGTLDTSKVKPGISYKSYTTITDAASAVGAISAVQDIEVLKPSAKVEDATTLPQILATHTDPDNLYSISFDFDKTMNKTSVEGGLQVVEDPAGTAVAVSAYPVWIEKTLHFIPDLNGLAIYGTDPLKMSTTYGLQLVTGATVRDSFGNELTYSNQSFVTRPLYGWYDGSAGSPGALGGGTEAKFAGPQTEYMKETYDMAVTIPVGARLEFSARNLAWDGISVALWDTTVVADPNNGILAHLRLGNWSNLEYKFVDPATGGPGSYTWWKSGNTPKVFNGTWQRYRIDFTASGLDVWVSTDGVSYEHQPDISIDATYDYPLFDSGNNKTILLRVSQPVAMDNLVITSIDGAGNLGTPGDLLDQNFDITAAAADARFTTEMNTAYGLTWWW